MKTYRTLITKKQKKNSTKIKKGEFQIDHFEQSLKASAKSVKRRCYGWVTAFCISILTWIAFTNNNNIPTLFNFLYCNCVCIFRLLWWCAWQWAATLVCWVRVRVRAAVPPPPSGSQRSSGRWAAQSMRPAAQSTDTAAAERSGWRGASGTQATPLVIN